MDPWAARVELIEHCSPIYRSDHQRWVARKDADTNICLWEDLLSSLSTSPIDYSDRLRCVAYTWTQMEDCRGIQRCSHLHFALCMSELVDCPNALQKALCPGGSRTNCCPLKASNSVSMMLATSCCMVQLICGLTAGVNSAPLLPFLGLGNSKTLSCAGKSGPPASSIWRCTSRLRRCCPLATPLPLHEPSVPRQCPLPSFQVRRLCCCHCRGRDSGAGT